MGGSTYLVPAPYTGMSSRAAHLRRNPPSGEPGTDYYMPTGTPLLAPTRCRVVHIGGSVVPATGRYVTLDDGTRWIRFLHLADWRARPGDELEPGDLVAISGASGYGSEFFGEPYRNTAFWANTGGDHVHVTAFRGRSYTFGSTGTVDFHALTGGNVASSSATDLTLPTISKEDDMATLITGGGQNLVVGPHLVGLTPDQVAAIKGAQVLEVHPTTHYNIIQAFQRANPSNAALPLVVYVRNGNGTAYLMTGGELEALVDPTTLAALHAQNAPTLTLSQAEVDNLLKG